MSVSVLERVLNKIEGILAPPSPHFATVTEKKAGGKDNEDQAVTGVTLDGKPWGLVADGIGGQTTGEIASKIIAETAKSLLNNRPAPQSQKEALDLAVNVIYQAHSKINVYNDAQFKEGKFSNSGTTVVLFIPYFENNQWYGLIVNKGDSIGYVLQPDGSNIQTKPHQQSFDRNSPITSYVGGNGSYQSLRADSIYFPLVAGTKIALTSDGISDNVNDDKILRTLAENKNATSAANTLLKQAKQGPKNDDRSAWILIWPNQPAPPIRPVYTAPAETPKAPKPELPKSPPATIQVQPATTPAPAPDYGSKPIEAAMAPIKLPEPFIGMYVYVHDEKVTYILRTRVDGGYHAHRADQPNGNIFRLRDEVIQKDLKPFVFGNTWKEKCTTINQFLWVMSHLPQNVKEGDKSFSPKDLVEATQKAIQDQNALLLPSAHNIREVFSKITGIGTKQTIETMPTIKPPESFEGMYVLQARKVYIRRQAFSGGGYYAQLAEQPTGQFYRLTDDDINADLKKTFLFDSTWESRIFKVANEDPSKTLIRFLWAMSHVAQNITEGDKSFSPKDLVEATQKAIADKNPDLLPSKFNIRKVFTKITGIGPKQL